MSKTQSIEIYLKPDIDEEMLVLQVWKAMTVQGRAQDLFRRMLMTGLRKAHHEHDLPRAISDIIDESGLMPEPSAQERRGPRKTRQRQNRPARSEEVGEGAATLPSAAPRPLATPSKLPLNHSEEPAQVRPTPAIAMEPGPKRLGRLMS